MGRPFITLGDATSHGGQVIEASAVTDAGGRRIARVGDKVKCPRHGRHGITVIVSGDPTMLIDGRPAAREGDLTDCGAALVASQKVTTGL